MEDICKKYFIGFKHEKLDEVCGYIKSNEQYEAFLNELTLNGFSFSTRSSGAHQNDTRIFFENGYPFTNFRHVYLQCCHGELYYETNKANRHDKQDHLYVKKKRAMKQTKKMGCQSKINVKIRYVFSGYGADPEKQTKYMKVMTARVLKKKFSDGLEVKKETWFYIQAFIKHNHPISKDQLPMHQELKSKIGELVENGITYVPEIKVHLDEKVKEMFKDKPVPDNINSSFFPKHSVIYNHVYRSFFSKDSNSDQETLENKRELWKNVIKTKRQSSGKRKQSRLVLLRRKLKTMLDLSYKIEDEEYLDTVLNNLSSMKKELGNHQKKRPVVIDNSSHKKLKKDQSITNLISSEVTSKLPLQLEPNQKNDFPVVYELVVEDGDLWRTDLNYCEISVINE